MTFTHQHLCSSIDLLGVAAALPYPSILVHPLISGFDVWISQI